MSAQIPPPPPQPPVGSQPGAIANPGPGRKWYAIALLVFVVIAVPSVIALIQGIRGVTAGLERMTVPGDATLDLEPGTWTVFYEHVGTFEGRTYSSTRTAPGMEISVRALGEDLPVNPSTARFDYSTGNSVGYSIASFETDHDGEHHVSVELNDQDDPEEYVLGFGRDIGRYTVATVMGAIGLIAGGFIAVTIWVIVLILRSRAKSRAQTMAYQ